MDKKKYKKESDSTTKEVFDRLDQTAIKSEKFLEKNLKILSYFFVGIIVIIIGYFSYINYYLKPRNVTALKEMAEAEKFFYQDSIKKALNGGGAYYGFEEIIKEFGNTSAGNIAKYYAAISYYKTKKYDKTIEYMDHFDTADDDVLEAIKYGVIGDAYVQKKEYNKALENYEKAIKNADELETLFVFFNKKAGILSYTTNNKKISNKYFNAILEKYPNTQSKDEIEKYAALTN